jgi:hypothetical protein
MGFHAKPYRANTPLLASGRACETGASLRDGIRGSLRVIKKNLILADNPETTRGRSYRAIWS